MVSINASSQGNTVPTPSICSLFETSIPGTSAATFTGDFYRDDEDDECVGRVAPWHQGRVLHLALRWSWRLASPCLRRSVEVWPVIVTSRAAAALASNTAQTFTLTCAVIDVPAEDAVVSRA